MKSSTQALKNWLKQRHAINSHRQVLLISVEESVHSELIEVLKNHFDTQLWLGFETDLKADEKINKCTTQNFRQFLGNETDLLAYNAFIGLKPSALYALEGCIKTSGLLVIFTPFIERWPKHEAHNRGLNFSHHDTHDESLFIKYFCDTLLSDKNTAFISDTDFNLPLVLDDSTATASKGSLASVQNSYLTNEQHLHLNTLTHRYAEQGNIKSIIIGKRGRGKSTLLGELYKWGLNTFESVFICAANRKNCDSIFKVIFEAYPNLSSNNVLFVSPDNLHSVDQSALVLIDEAAALAPSIIISAFKRLNNIVIATTEIGYEGSGLGFNKKLKPLLQRDKTVKSIELLTPIRWPADDPLEPLFEKVFASHYSKGKTKSFETFSNNHSSLSNLRFEFIDSSNKTEQQIGKLIECHQLLMSAHYQTTPDDLMRLLDSDDQAVIIAHVNNIICGACIVVKEHLTVDEELAHQIISSQRRLSGNLSLQTIASMLFDQNCLTLNCWRVTRIAVLENVQNQSIGSQLLSCTEKLALNNNVDLLSTSFGIEASLLRFWRNANFKLIKIGTRRDTSSGHYSGLFIKPINQDIEPTTLLLVLRFELTKIYLGELGVLMPTLLRNEYNKQKHYLSTQARQAFEKLVADKTEAIIANELKITNTLEELFFVAHQLQSNSLLILLRKLMIKGNSAELKLTLNQQIIDILESLNMAS